MYKPITVFNKAKRIVETILPKEEHPNLELKVREPVSPKQTPFDARGSMTAIESKVPLGSLKHGIRVYTPEKNRLLTSFPRRNKTLVIGIAWTSGFEEKAKTLTAALQKEFPKANVRREQK
ncbi:MAG: hypothetical protein V1817_01265 [Candidatus Micrarchaeota archaeon]